MTNVNSRIVWILGDRGSGKTMLASIIGNDYKTVYCNYDLIYSNDSEVIIYDNLYFDTHKSEYYFITKDGKKYLEYHENGGLIIFDESAVNLNSRNFQTKENKIVNQMIAVCRKFNLELLFISQVENIDKNIRENINYRIEVHKIDKKKIISKVEVYKHDLLRNKNYLNGSYTIKLLDLLQYHKIKYDTLQISHNQKEKKEKKEKKIEILGI